MVLFISIFVHFCFTDDLLLLATLLPGLPDTICDSAVAPTGDFSEAEIQKKIFIPVAYYHLYVKKTHQRGTLTMVIDRREKEDLRVCGKYSAVDFGTVDVCRIGT